MLEELARLPVQLRRNMATFVEIAESLPVMANDEGRRWYTIALDGKSHPFAAIDKLGAGTDQA